MQAKDTELRKIADIKNNVGDGLCPIREKTSHKETETVLEPLQDAYIKNSAILKGMDNLSKQDKWGEIST